MKKNESLYPADWFEIGAKDMKRAENLLALHDLEGSGFNIQQALEKYLKGYLLSKGWELKRIHSLETLLNDVIDYELSFEEFREECMKITFYYVQERYPLIAASEITEEEIKKSLQVAKRIVNRILELMH